MSARNRRSAAGQALAAALFVATSACSEGDPTVDSSDTGGAPGQSGGATAERGGAAGESAGGTTSTGGGTVVSVAGSVAAAGAAETGGDCGATRLEAEQPIANVLLVIDKSSSMLNDGGFSDSKWVTLGAALGPALQEAQDRVSFGLEFYPFGDDPDAEPATCGTTETVGPLVPVAPGVDSVPEIVAALESYDPAGGTPTAAALGRADDYFESGDGAALEGDRYVLLATDGGPNCNEDLACDAETCTINMEGLDCGGNCCDPMLDDNGPASCLDEARTIEQVTALADAGVKTFVVGIPGSQFYGETLDRMAEAGLVPNPAGPTAYYKVTADGGLEGLSQVFTEITRAVLTTCRLQLTSEPPDRGKVNVEIDGETILQPGDDGWEYEDETASPPVIVLKGSTCEIMETMGAESVTVTFGCVTKIDEPE